MRKDKKNVKESAVLSEPVAFSEGLTINYPEYPMKNEEHKPTAESGGNKKNKGGRPTDYKPEYASQVEKLCLLGATDKEIAGFFHVAESALNRWKIKHPEFKEAIKRGKQFANANVATRLYQKCLGYEHDDVDIRVIDGKIVQTKIRKHYPPDTLSIIYFLNNREPDKWRQKQDITHKLGDGKIKVVITKPKPTAKAKEKK